MMAEEVIREGFVKGKNSRRVNWRTILAIVIKTLDELPPRSATAPGSHHLLHTSKKDLGKNMSDTIELLDTIGRNASLRYASAEQLTAMLEQAQASEALSAAAAHGDSSLLFAELGQKQNETPQSIQSPSHEENEEESEDDPAPEAR